jgi:hypothetical protein
MTLPVFRSLGFYVIGVCASTYWAALAYRLADRFAAPAAIPAFIIVAIVGVSFETFRLAVRLRHGKPSGVAVFCFILSRFSIAYAIILIIGGIIERYVGGSYGYIFDWYGFFFGGMYALAFTSGLTHYFALEEDLKHPKPVDPEEDARERRKYMHPYI